MWSRGVPQRRGLLGEQRQGLSEAVAALTLDQLAGVYVIGAAAAAPTLPRTLAEQLGVAPVVLPDPG